MATDIPISKNNDPIWYEQFHKDAIGLDCVGYGIAYRGDLVPTPHHVMEIKESSAKIDVFSSVIAADRHRDCPSDEPGVGDPTRKDQDMAIQLPADTTAPAFSGTIKQVTYHGNASRCVVELRSGEDLILHSRRTGRVLVSRRRRFGFPGVAKTCICFQVDALWPFPIAPVAVAA